MIEERDIWGKGVMSCGGYIYTFSSTYICYTGEKSVTEIWRVDLNWSEFWEIEFV